jgi:type VI secretion system protein ImpG
MKSRPHEDLLRYYKDELTYLRQMGGEFARAYPRVAERLELGHDECADPQVERLIQSFAFLSARLQRDLDGELPEVTTALLGILYPQLVNPIPSMAVARFDADPKQVTITTGHTIARHTRLFAETKEGHTCRFRTCYPVTLWPITVTGASFAEPRNWHYKFLDSMSDVAGVLRISLRVDGGGSLKDLDLRRLRFYLNAAPLLANTLYELLFCHARHVKLLPEGEDQPVDLPDGSIKPVGFGPEEDVLHYPPQSHRGYRLLQEYFSFPNKFLFFDLDNLDQLRHGSAFDALFLLDREPSEQLVVNAGTFALGCAPVVNLFPKTTEPIRLDHRSIEYKLVPDKRRERTTEIHSILSVSAASNANDRARDFKPFYSYSHAMDGAGHKAFWHARREYSLDRNIPGTEVFLSFLDLDFKPAHPPDEVVYAHALCTNRELATQMHVGDPLQIEEQAPLLGIQCLTTPTWPVQPHLRGATLWRLVSHLSLNHLSLSEEGGDSLPALQEILKLYSSSDRPATQHQIAGVVGLECGKVMRRVGRDAWRGFRRGTLVTVKFDEARYVGSGAFLLASVLEKFFALYASVNSFTILRAVSRQREGVWKEWPPAAGEKIIL